MSFIKITDIEAREITAQHISVSEKHDIQIEVEDTIDVEVVDIGDIDIAFEDS